MSSMFAIYIHEDEEGNLYVRADSYGKGMRAISLGLDTLSDLIQHNENTDEGILFMLPVDRCELVQ